MATKAGDAAGGKKERLLSLDAFRGLTILGMVFVIAIAAGGYWKELDNPTPQKMSWFGSIPVSTWYHSDMGFEGWVYEQEQKSLSEEQIEALPEYQEMKARSAVGLTITDLVAPWFVFIVGVCIPLSRSRRGGDWWKHVSVRTLMLILAGVIYISLVIKQTTWWWGILQAIGVAYFCGAAMCRLPKGAPRWGAVFGVALFNLLMTQATDWWTGAFENIAAPFGTLTNPNGSWLKVLTIHCQPWLSISYGTMTMIGVLVGEAVITQEKQTILKRCLLVAGTFMVLGYAIHKVGMVTGDYRLAFDKPNVTTSYAFFSSGLGALVFLGFYWVIDVMKIGAWAKPLNVYGRNPLLAYFMMIILRRALESLGLIDIFNRVPDNKLVLNWATFAGHGEPAAWVLDFFSKGGYMGVFWGLVWCLVLWLVVLWFNKRELYWKF